MGKPRALGPAEINRLKLKGIQAARAAGRELMRYFGRSFDVRSKRDEGLVSDADLAAEKAILRVLGNAHPEMGILTEETGLVAAASGRGRGKWIVDPLDGTTNFVHGFPMFCVSVAAEWKGEVVVGVVYHPAFDELYVATRGGGAWLFGGYPRAALSRRKRRLSVSSTAKISDSLLTTGFTYRKKTWLHVEMESFERLSLVARAIRRPGSAALDLAYTARGVFDGFWERGLSSWDVAAGSLLVREAGGKVTDFKGKACDLYGGEILATNRRLAGPLLQAIAPEVCPI